MRSEVVLGRSNDNTQGFIGLAENSGIGKMFEEAYPKVSLRKGDETPETGQRRTLDRIGNLEKEKYDEYDFSTPTSLKDSASKLLGNLSTHNKAVNFDWQIFRALTQGKLPDLVEEFNKQLKDRGAELTFTLDSSIGRYGHRVYSVNLFNRSGKLLDSTGAATTPNQPIGDYKQSAERRLNTNQKMSKDIEQPMSRREIERATEKIASALLDGSANRKKIELQLLLQEAEVRWSLDRILANTNRLLQARGSGLTLHTSREYKEAWREVRDADPIVRWDEFKVSVKNAGQKQVNEFNFSIGVLGPKKRWY
ncbi:MAG: hypothetical protein K2X77_06170 [Candidatus Obscuribacterales bacterium]|jgi:hypothetical protein|nr:hypothetical protein [Candidatus Obscuribacterales bacterium]